MDVPFKDLKKEQKDIIFYGSKNPHKYVLTSSSGNQNHRNGYIEGIKNMSKSLLKDCKNVNNMGILDPKIINNPAVYSIITTKY